MLGKTQGLNIWLLQARGVYKSAGWEVSSLEEEEFINHIMAAGNKPIMTTLRKAHIGVASWAGVPAGRSQTITLSDKYYSWEMSKRHRWKHCSRYNHGERHSHIPIIAALGNDVAASHLSLNIERSTPHHSSLGWERQIHDMPGVKIQTQQANHEMPDVSSAIYQ